MRIVWGIAVAVVLCFGLSLSGRGSVAEAQRTGGSMGGGSFSSGSSSRSSSSSYSGSSSGSSYRGSSSSSSGGGCDNSSRTSTGGSGCSDSDAGIVMAFCCLGVILVGAYVWADMASRSRAQAGSGYIAPSSEQMDVSVLYVALDARVRAALQKKLAAIAATCDTSTNHGLVKLLREVAIELRRCRESWVYTGVHNADPMSPERAESLFQSLVARARAGYEDELVRASDGVTRRGDDPELVARTEEGDGLVLITLAVAARGELYDVVNASDPEHVRRALEGISALTAYRLVAVEIIWTPAAETDRMSSVELEARYPQLKKLEDALGGKVTCGFCGGGFPEELLSCPHCGGVAKSA